jgi:hypothetical protein
LSSATSLDEARNILLYLTVLQGQTDLLTGGVVGDANRACDIGKSPQGRLCEVKSFFLEILEFVAGSLPLLVPAASCFFQDLDSRLIVIRVGRHVDLSLLQLGLVLALLLSHDHMALSKIALDPQTILFIFVATLVHVSSLSLFHFV